MLKVDRQSGGFTPLSETCRKKYLSVRMPVVPYMAKFLQPELSYSTWALCPLNFCYEL